METRQRTKKRGDRPFMRRTDAIWLLLFLLLSAFLFWRNMSRSPEGLVAGVYFQNRLIDVIDLDHPAPRQFSYPQNPAVVFSVAADGSIAFISSNCPDQVCVHSGRLKHAGDYAACLPNSFVLRLGERKDIGAPDYRSPGRGEGDQQAEAETKIQLPTGPATGLTVDTVQ